MNHTTWALAKQISKLFAFQSYHDSTLLENAILSQPRNVPIVPSTKIEDQTPGYAVGLAPWSQTPIAVEFLSGTASDASGPLVLKPGQVVRPRGYNPKDPQPFGGFRWGLPFGWLGGGLATLYVFLAPDAYVDWGTDCELIFHRVRVPVLQPADLTAAGSNNNARRNWPMRFPWTQAIQGANAIGQQGQPTLAIVRPTKTLMVLRGISGLAAPADMRLIFQGTNDVGLNSAGAVVNTNPVFQDVTWGTWTNTGASGNLATQNPTIWDSEYFTRLAADDGGVALVDISGAALLSGAYVDFVRYGKL